MTQQFWPEGIKLVVSVTMGLESGGQPDNAESPFSGAPMGEGHIDYPARSWWQYGAREGVPRLLDLWDEFGIKVTSHMIGKAVETYPELAKEIVDRGHEAGIHGWTWEPQWDLEYDEEKRLFVKNIEIVKKVTGFNPRGFNAFWMRRSPNTLKIFQELGIEYHTDDLRYDEVFSVDVNGKEFFVVPYTLRNNDIVNYEGKGFSADQYGKQLKYEFDQLYREAEHKRRHMSISAHPRIGGTPANVAVLREFIEYANQHAGVKFMRKDEMLDAVIEKGNYPKVKDL